MEKIYMEENKKGKGFRVVNFSVVLSFAVAFFAIISLATFGVVSNQGMEVVSYAAPAASNIISGNTFEFTYKDPGNLNVYVQSESVSNGTFNVPVYTANSSETNPVFCVEHNVNAPAHGTTMNKDGEIKDYGLLYILNNSYANGSANACTVKKSLSVTDEHRPYVEQWITQTAIWMYLQGKYGNETRDGVYAVTGEDDVLSNNVKVNYLSDDNIAAITNATTLYKTNLAGTPELLYQGSNIYNLCVKDLVDTAISESGTKLLAVVVADGEIAKTDDGKYYQSPLVSVLGNPKGDFNNFNITLSGLDDAFIVDKDGKTIAMENIDKDTTFYVRVPVDKVSNETKRLKITAEGHFTTLAGNYFMAANEGNSYQKVITVTGATKNVIVDNHVDFVGVPDSGMNTAQTIYFIGLIVLLCGVGIVYANAKPVESKQQ